MKKKCLFESVIIAATLTALAFSALPLAFAAYPGPDNASDDSIWRGTNLGEGTYSNVGAEYSEPGLYDSAFFLSGWYLGSSGFTTGGFYGPLHYWWVTDLYWIEDVVYSDYIDGALYGETSYALCYSAGWFYEYDLYPEPWVQVSYAYVIAE